MNWENYIKRFYRIYDVELDNSEQTRKYWNGKTENEESAGKITVCA